VKARVRHEPVLDLLGPEPGAADQDRSLIKDEAGQVTIGGCVVRRVHLRARENNAASVGEEADDFPLTVLADLLQDVVTHFCIVLQTQLNPDGLPDLNACPLRPKVLRRVGPQRDEDFGLRAHVEVTEARNVPALRRPRRSKCP